MSFSHNQHPKDTLKNWYVFILYHKLKRVSANLKIRNMIFNSLSFTYNRHQVLG